MANYLINAANQSAVGTTTSDLFQVTTAAALGLTVQGLDGDDTFTAATNGNFTNALVQVGAGNDTIRLNTAAFQLASIYGGGGDDLISALSASAQNTTIQGGGGNDTLYFSGGTITSSIIGLNAGNDLLSMTAGASANFTSTDFNLGGGNDTFNVDSASFTTSIINGGGGADLISADGVSASGVTINLDVLGSGDYGNDTLNFGGVVGISSKVIGGGGADSILLSGSMGQDSFVAGNYGKDTIGVSAVTTGVSATIGGGAGKDFITLSATQYTGSNVYVKGGGHDDIISAVGGATGSLGTIVGGAGADTINLGTVVSSQDQILDYSAASESNISSYDVVSSTVAINAGFHIRAGGFMSATTSVRTAALLSNGLVTASTSGLVAFTSTVGGGVTARVAAMDKLLTVGLVATFADSNGVDYVFIQGGTAGGGNADDLLVQVNTALTATATFAINGGTSVEINLA